MKVWIITGNDYDDYELRGVFSTQEKAEEALKLYGSCGITEYEVDPALPEHPPGLYAWRVSMDIDGSPGEPEQMDADGFAERTWGAALHNQPGRCIVTHCCWARDKEHAVALTEAKRLRLIADGGWKVGVI